MIGAPRYAGKVREIYDAGADCLLIVASDRISAFDVVFAEPVPDKGRVLTAMTQFWSEALAEVAPTHVLSSDPSDFPAAFASDEQLVGRAMLVRRAEMLPLECIVRGYLTGSAWREYQATGQMHGEPLPDGLRESERLPAPAFTPSTKASAGHDVNISFEQAAALVGRETAEAARRLCVEAYTTAQDLAAARGIVIADTKFELGWVDGVLTICDEILTPDSSRFWPADALRVGNTPPSLDKQPVRDWAESTGWDKTPPPPPLPDAVVAATRARYVAAYEALSGRSFSSWWGVRRR